MTLRCVALALGLIGGTSRQASAQVRPDSAKRDTVKKTVPVAAPVPIDTSVVIAAPALPKVGSREDSLMQMRIRARTDSIAKVRAGDTVRAPIARFEEPKTFDAFEPLRWNRQEILSSGALNLADLLDHVPGVTSFRSGWIAGIHAASYNGDFNRIRVFLDGVEMDAVEARNGGILDLDDVPLWTLDALLIERSAGEVRVWLRSWSYQKTIPYTRADIFTGDRNTNGFRGLFARRYSNGFILQVAAQQAATQSGRVSAFSTSGVQASRGDGSQQVINSRVGWSKRRLTIDLYGTVSTRDRDPQTPRKDFTRLPAFKGARREGYLRAGFGDTSQGFWTQAIVATVVTRLDGIRDTTTTGTITPTDTTPVAASDSLRSRTQQIVAVGFRGARWQYSVTNRMRSTQGKLFHSPLLRASIGTQKLSAGLFAEQRGIDSTRRIEVSARAEPLPWLVVALSQSLRSPSSSTERASTSTTRAEAGIRLGTLMVGGGVVREDTATYSSPLLLAASDGSLTAGPALGLFGSARGRIYKDLRLDVQGIRWNTAQFGRSRTNVRTELALVSDWRTRFPKGQFTFNARLTYDMRDGVPFYYGIKPDKTFDIRTSVPANVLSGLVEIRIQRATLFYVYRNLTGGDYEQIPGLTMPSSVQMYGVRWEFAN